MTHETLLAWLAAREPNPPTELAKRLEAAVVAADLVAVEGVPEGLAEAAFPLLDRASVANRSDRSVAAELLVADALITYALEAQAGRTPDALAEFAAELARRAGAGA